MNVSNDWIRALRAFTPHKLAKAHGGEPESHSEREWLFRCPLCGSSRLRYNMPKQTWICWGCKTTGDAVKLVMLLERCDMQGAVEFITHGYVGGENRLDKLDDIFGSAGPIVKRKQLRKLPNMGLPFTAERLDDESNPLHDHAWDYMRSRGVMAEWLREMPAYFCRMGREKNYVLFPCHMDGVIAYWQGRATWDPPTHLDKPERKAWVKRTEYRKTLNPPNTRKMATAEEALYNFDRAKTEHEVVVCEGPFDAIKIGPHAVATLGKAVGTVKVERLARMQATSLIIYRDHSTNPKVSLEESAASLELAAELAQFASVKIATPPRGRDAGSFSREENARILATAVPYQSGSLVSDLRG